MKRLAAAVQTLVHVDVGIVDALAVGHALRELACSPSTPIANREIYRRVGAQLVAEADAAIMLAVGPPTMIPAAPRNHASFTTERNASGDGQTVRCGCGLAFGTAPAFTRHLEENRRHRRASSEADK